MSLDNQELDSFLCWAGGWTTFILTVNWCGFTSDLHCELVIISNSPKCEMSFTDYMFHRWVVYKG